MTDCSNAVAPFVLHIPDADLDDLRARLARTRWPTRETVGDTSQGPQLKRMQALVDYWGRGYDWRRAEDLLNGLGQYRTTIDGLGVHFVHVRSGVSDALPLVLTHGWPGSVFEFRHVIDRLTDPVAHGGDDRDAFHVIIPSLPGFGFSDQPDAAGWGPARIADAWIELVRRLGYDSWAAQGGDWGAPVTDAIGRKAPAGLIGMHFNLPLVFPTPEEVADATPEEQAMIATAMRFEAEQSAYMKQQATRPQTIGYGLSDSPVGLAAWIYALIQDFSDSEGDPESLFGMDAILDDITLYWLTNTAASSARLYWEGAREQTSQPPASEPNPTPAGFSIFPKEGVRASRRWIEKRYSTVLHYNQLQHGGHFAAWEQPAVFVDEVRATFRPVR